MNIYILLLSKLLISVAVSIVVLAVLSRPLTKILNLICPDEAGAIFWVSYTKLMLVIAPFLLVLVVDFCTRNAEPLNSLRLAVIAALAGMLLGLHIVGKRVGQFAKAPAANGVRA